MSRPLLLIAGREFRAYVATTSFWIALFVGPAMMAGLLALASAGGRPPPATPIRVEAAEPALARSATAALVEAAGIDGAAVVVAGAGDLTAMRLTLRRNGLGGVEASLDRKAPLSAAARALIARSIERDELLRMASAGAAIPAVRITQPAQPSRAAGLKAAQSVSRFCLVLILWLTLTGSLGMLLQAVVRERSNRALESLLAAASPSEIVFGKLLGVGAVSLLVLGSWLGSAAALAPLAAGHGEIVAAMAQAFATPLLLARAGLLYGMGFAFYGLLTIALAAPARDSAAAQNLSRPMFAVLLAAFFAALAASGGGPGLAWLIYAPPFTPFMLLLLTDSASLLGQSVALALLAAATGAAGLAAVNGLSLTPAAPIGARLRIRPSPATTPTDLSHSS